MILLGETGNAGTQPFCDVDFQILQAGLGGYGRARSFGPGDAGKRSPVASRRQDCEAGRPAVRRLPAAIRNQLVDCNVAVD